MATPSFSCRELVARAPVRLFPPQARQSLRTRSCQVGFKNQSWAVMEFYENFISKVQSAPTWPDDSERILVEPYTYLASVPGKEVRSALMDAFNAWIQVPAEDLAVVKKLVEMLHTASLL
ncbi:BQ5605_C002g01491 [Microbotryum silenes-dioicae]|uniref:BQ5605_C002g01491 protein n=1 Tax=Microbotryum silenes-dioicae TaxID=796604 RepID=A0A2X0M2S5_9BASI|nr:BQ5605_C002g01491 [Microbotryum silenes-dioicae]